MAQGCKLRTGRARRPPKAAQERKFYQTLGYHAFQHVLPCMQSALRRLLPSSLACSICENRFSVPSMLLVFSGSVARPVGLPMLPRINRAGTVNASRCLGWHGVRGVLVRLLSWITPLSRPRLLGGWASKAFQAMYTATGKPSSARLTGR